jgi:ABC-2 type transport system permease protein
MISPLPDDNASPWPRNVYLVARREVLMRLRSRVFTVTTIVMVVLVAGSVLVASYLQTGTPSQPEAVHVGFSSGSQALEPAFNSVATALGVTVTVTNVADPATGRSQVQAGTLDMAVSGSATAPTAVVSESLPAMVEIALDAATEDARMATAGLTPAAITSITAGVPFEPVQPTGSSSPLNQGAFVGIAVGLLLFVALGTAGSQVAQGVVEEKATRIMEILLATVRPSELLAGKVLGIGLVALLQLAIEAAAALITVELTNGVSIPALGAALGIGYVVAYLAWFVLGFLMYATALAAVAALVSRAEEVAYATAPANLLLLGSFICSLNVFLRIPASPLSTALSVVPPLAPTLMPMRIAEGIAEPWQVGLAMALTVATIAGEVWLAGRIYANSAMRTGARVRFMEAFRG